VYVRNATTNQVLRDQSAYQATGVGAGTGTARSYTFNLPDGTGGVGDLEIRVTADSSNGVVETNGTGETNNLATINATSTLAVYPDLRVRNLAVAPASPHSGDTLTLTWDEFDAGSSAVTGSFYTRVYVRNTHHRRDPPRSMGALRCRPGGLGRHRGQRRQPHHARHQPGGGLRLRQRAALAQRIDHEVLGRGLTTSEFADLLWSTGDLILGGDDEIDNVVNTGLQYPGSTSRSWRRTLPPSATRLPAAVPATAGVGPADWRNRRRAAYMP
jgi:hypothetical protein